jgi:hypothetical protein
MGLKPAGSKLRRGISREVQPGTLAGNFPRQVGNLKKTDIILIAYRLCHEIADFFVKKWVQVW